MTEVLGLRLDRALERLRVLGVNDPCVMQTASPRRGEGKGELRVVRVRDGGREVLVARFPDEVEPYEGEPEANLEDCERASDPKPGAVKR